MLWLSLLKALLTFNSLGAKCITSISGEDYFNGYCFRTGVMVYDQKLVCIV